MQGILVDDERDKKAPATILAERGRLLEGPNGPRVLLVSGSRQEIDHQTGRLDLLTFRENVVDLSDNSHQDGPRLLDMSEASIPNLLRSARPTFRRLTVRAGSRKPTNACPARSRRFPMPLLPCCSR